MGPDSRGGRRLLRSLLPLAWRASAAGLTAASPARVRVAVLSVSSSPARGIVALAVLLAAVAALSTSVSAQAPAPPEVRAGRVAGPLRLDGVPDEPAWLTTDSITAFTQRDPAEGQPSTERTVVRILAAPDGLWIAFWCYDRQPGRVVRAQLRRDADLDSDDHVSLFLDPQRDRRSGYLFQVNANGAMYDGEFAGGHETNDDWNGVWDARARLGADGWTAELFVPWQTLRYRRDGSAWGLNVGRYIRAANEETMWRGWRRQQGLLFTDEEGLLADLGPLPARRLTEWRPHVLATATDYDRDYSPDGTYSVSGARRQEVKAGLDGKLAVAPTLTLDLTANTDFAQVEVDQQVVNLTRFPLFFPEKRPFFLEASGTFAFGQEERTLAFYSRRIGLGADRAPVPIDAGMRLTGRVGTERLGLLAVRTGGSDGAFDIAARLKHDVLSRGYVGGIVTGRGGPGVRGTRLTAGADFELPFVVGGQNLVLSGFGAATRDSSGAPVATAWRLFIDFPNDWTDTWFALSRIEAGFDPALGFVRQTGVWRHTGQFEFSPRPHVLGIRKLTFKAIEWDVSLNIDGGVNNASYEVVPFGAEFESGDEVELALRRSLDVPPEAFDIWDVPAPGGDRTVVTIPAGRYAWNRADLGFHTSSGRPVSVELGAGVGQFYTGTSTSLEGGVDVRVAPHVIASWNGSTEWVRLPQGDFTAQTSSARLDYAASPRLGGTLWVQWDSESDRLTVNARLHWIPKPGSDAYLVWNSAWPTGLERGGIPWRRPLRGALVGKLVYYFRA
jgi:hypothetical protein